MFRKSFYYSFILLLPLYLIGCGFHLRGIINAPKWLNNVCIIVQEAQPDIIPLLKDQLQSYNIQVTDSPAMATYWLIIESDTIQQHITSVSSGTTSRQYQLIYTVRFNLQYANGKERLASQTISITRQITTNNNRILGSNEEEALIKREMKHDAVTQIFNRIGSTRAH